MCHSAKNGKGKQNWHKPFSTKYGTFPIDPKLAETAPCSKEQTPLCHFCKEWDIGPMKYWAKDLEVNGALKIHYIILV